MKVRAISFSDLHYDDWSSLKGRTSIDNIPRVALRSISSACIKHNCSALFSGDLFHKPQGITNSVFNNFLHDYYNLFELNGIHFYAISGNHDHQGVNHKLQRSINYLQVLDEIFPTFHLIDYKRVKIQGFPNTWVTGIPYSINNQDLTSIQKPKEKHNILLIHSNLPGAEDPNGFKSDSVDNIDSFDIFNGYDLVLSGHIHKPSILSNNIVMVGAPYQQRSSDMGCEMGYWEIYEDFKFQFVHLDNLPMFRKKKTKKHHDDKDIYLPKQLSIKVGSHSDSAIIYESKNPVKIGEEYLKKSGIDDKYKKDALLNSLR